MVLKMGYKIYNPQPMYNGTHAKEFLGDMLLSSGICPRYLAERTASGKNLPLQQSFKHCQSSNAKWIKNPYYSTFRSCLAWVEQDFQNC